MAEDIVKKGTIVEFTDSYQRDYTLGDKALARYGFVNEDCYPFSPIWRVKIANGDILEIHSYQIQAYGWAGWMPEDLEKLFEDEYMLHDGYVYGDEDY